MMRRIRSKSLGSEAERLRNETTMDHRSSLLLVPHLDGILYDDHDDNDGAGKEVGEEEIAVREDDIGLLLPLRTDDDESSPLLGRIATTTSS